MSTLRLNLLANLLGSGWLAFVQFLAVPLYLQLLGIEGYALIGFFLTLQGALRVLDLGLAATVNRELARYSVDPARTADARDCTRTFEAFYWVGAVVIAAAIWVASPAIALRWLQDGSLPDQTLVSAVGCMGLLAGAQWPLSLYQGALLGLERQALLNSIRAGMATAMAAAGVAVLAAIEPSVTLFFWSQIGVTLVHVAIMRAAVWRSLPAPATPARVRPALFIGVSRFALGISGITLCSLVLTQADKIVLSRLLSLEQFGYYSLASVASSALAAMNAPVFNAVFPRLTVLVAQGRASTLRPLFRLASQGVAVVTVPVALVMAMFSQELVTVWTGNAEAARQVAPILAILALGTALNILMNLPYALQLAHGWTQLALALNLTFAVAIVPALLFAVELHAALGAATVWALVNLAYVAVGVPATHRRLFGDFGWHWFGDVSLILLASTVVVGLWRMSAPPQPSPVAALALVTGAVITGTVASAALSTQLRAWTLGYLAARTGRLA